MKMIPEALVNFFRSQGVVIVSSIDAEGFVHNACKGIVSIASSGEVFLLDLYAGRTLKNLQNNPVVSITAIDEHAFIGYSLKGTARIIPRDEVSPDMLRLWDDKITSRLTQRLLRNMKEEKSHSRHPEVLLPQPQYMIAVKILECIDLTPHHLK